MKIYGDGWLKKKEKIVVAVSASGGKMDREEKRFMSNAEQERQINYGGCDGQRWSRQPNSKWIEGKRKKVCDYMRRKRSEEEDSFGLGFKLWSLDLVNKKIIIKIENNNKLYYRYVLGIIVILMNVETFLSL